MSKKSEKKQKDKGIKVISSPLNFQHRVHVGADRVDIQELQALFETAGKTGNTQLQTPPPAPEVSKQGLSNNNVGGSNTPLVFTPPPPCPNGDISGEGKYQTVSLIQLLKEELIPALRFELDQLLEEKLAKWFQPLSERSDTAPAPLQHCKTHCKCQTLLLNQSVRPPPLVTAPSGRLDTQFWYQNGGAASGDSSTDTSPASSPTVDIARNDLFVHNPVYPVESERHVIPHIEPHNGFDSHRSGNQVNSVDKPPRSQGRQLQNNKEPLLPDHRECLARALQTNVAALVESLATGQGDLQQALLTDKCITKEELDDVMKLPDVKSQTRATLVLIKGRDLGVLDNFLKRLRKQRESLYKSVMDAYEVNKRDGLQNKQCVLCKLMSRVNLKYIIDMLWSSGIVDDDLFQQVRGTPLPGGAQELLWQRTVYSINLYMRKDKLKVMSTVKESLCRFHHYDDLANALETYLEVSDSLECMCDPRDQNFQCDRNENNQNVVANRPKMGLNNKSRELNQNKTVTDGLQRRKEARVYINTVDQAILPDKPVLINSPADHSCRSSYASANADVKPCVDITEHQRTSTFGRMARACVSLEDLSSLGNCKGDHPHGEQRSSDGVTGMKSHYNGSLTDVTSGQELLLGSPLTDAVLRTKKPVPLRRITKLGERELQASYV